MFELARPFLLALAIGLLIGIERERAHRDDPAADALGSRTITVLALLGAVAAFVDNSAIAAVIAAFAGAAILAGYLRSPARREGSDPGLTTEVAAMATFVLGYLTREAPWLACMLAVIVLAMLALKPAIHRFARAGIKQRELSAALTFLVIAFVVLPLLPARPVDPWGLFNPARLWFVLVLIAGISFGGYIAMRVFGPSRGLPLAGLAAGLVSSTAATLTLSQRARENPALDWPATIGIVLANAASAAAQLMIVAAICPALFPEALPVIGLPVLLGAAGSSLALSLRGREGEEAPFEIGNPLALRSTVAFASVLAIVLVVVTVASRAFGPTGTLVTAAIGGTADVHAVTLALANLVAAGDLGASHAVLAILAAFASNMVVKMGLVAWAGGARLVLRVWPALIAMTLAAVAAFYLL
jgi:uncharacterized membrane protein (DUF4010 family)